MDAKAKEEANGPLGVIGCLLAGFELLGHNLWLLVLPVLLDLFYLIGPQLSMAPILLGVADFIKSQSVQDPEMAKQFLQMAQAVEEFGVQFNLFSLLDALPILSVPSLLAPNLLTPQLLGTTSPLGTREVLLVSSLPIFAVWAAALIPVGVALGYLYLSGVARTVQVKWPVHKQAKQASATSAPGPRLYPSSEAGKAIRLVLFTVIALAVAMAFGLFWLFLIQAAMVTGWVLLWILAFISTLIVGYVAIHFLFVIPGILVGGRGLLRATFESIALTHAHLPATTGLVVLILLLTEGLGYAWALPAADSWLMLIGIAGNSCIATALITSIFVFYHERIAYLPEPKPAPA